MTVKRIPRPRDPIQLGKLMVDIATGQVVDEVDDGKDEKAASTGREGGLVGGRSRALALTPEQRAEIARKAATSRWATASARGKKERQ